jgi:hypothetical protein
MDLNPDEVRIKREMVDACERVIGIFDHTKWLRTALFSFVETGQIDALVTDARAPGELVAEWRERGVDVVCADPASDGGANAPSRRPRRSPGRRATDRKEVADTIGSE